MEEQANQPADKGTIYADELQVASDRIFDPIGDRLRIPAADCF